jgi:hypothetical protein
MSRKKPASRSPPRHSSDLQRLWRALLLTSWRCLVVIPATPSTSAAGVLGALRSVLTRETSSSLDVVDGSGASMSDGDRLARMVSESTSEGRRVIAFIDPITQSLAGVPLVRAADSVLLVVQLESPDVESLASTLSIVGTDRIVGSVAVPASG